jgi:hypothetical protein
MYASDFTMESSFTNDIGEENRMHATIIDLYEPELNTEAL